MRPGRTRRRASGICRRSPELDATLDVRGNVELAVKAQRDALNEFNEISLKFAEPDAVLMH